jgi:hypothetical protein
MQVTNDPDLPSANSEWTACLERARLAVLNILVAVGLTIAVGGWLLRNRAAVQRPPTPRPTLPMLMLLLIMLAIASYLTRRTARGRAAAKEPRRRQASFYWSHVLSAGIAALAAPLGIFCGWFIDPRFEAVIPFWVVALALGFQAIPRIHELDDFALPSTDPGEPPS